MILQFSTATADTHTSNQDKRRKTVNYCIKRNATGKLPWSTPLETSKDHGPQNYVKFHARYCLSTSPQFILHTYTVFRKTCQVQENATKCYYNYHSRLSLCEKKEPEIVPACSMELMFMLVHSGNTPSFIMRPIRKWTGYP